MKRNLFLIIVILLLCPIIVNASTNTIERDKDNLRIPDKIKYKSNMYDNIMTTPSVDASEKIYDFANLFTDSEELELYQEVSTFISNTNLDLVIVTISDNTKYNLGSYDNLAMIYADDFYDYNDFDYNGVLYLIDMETRVFYISTSGTALLYYDSDRIEDTLSSIDNSMYNGNYKESITIMIANLKRYYDLGYSANSNYTISKGMVVRKTPYLLFILVGLIVSLITTFSLAKRNKKVKLAVDSDTYLAKNGIKITRRQDNYLRSDTVSHYSPISSDSGGSSGGSSFHSGSSGMSHGGGGHHF